MEQPKKKRRVELTVADNMPIEAIALVAHPAIGENFLTFSNHKKVYAKLSAVGDKVTIVGPILIPNLDINRIDPNTGEQYTVFFSEETVEKIARNYLKAHRQDAVNVEHTLNMESNICLSETWTVFDPTNDKASALGYDMPKSTWLGLMESTNPQLADDVRSGKVKGFSIQGSFIEKTVELSEETTTKQNMKRTMKRKLSMYKKIKEALGLEKFADDTLADGTMITSPDGDFVVGSIVNVVQADGTEMPLPDGTYTLSDGTMITVAAGSITEVAEGAPVEGETGEMAEAAPAEDAPAAEDAAPGESKDLQEQIDALVKEIEAMKKAMNMKEAELSTATDQITSLSKEKTELEAKVVELSALPGTSTVKKTAMAQAIANEKNSHDSRLDALRKLRAQK
jgi:hypothetical protein